MEAREAVRQFIVANFYVPDGTAIADDQSLLDSGIIDSTGVLELIGFIEERFSVRVEDVEMVPENLDSIGRIADFVARKTGGGSER